MTKAEISRSFLPMSFPCRLYLPRAALPEWKQRHRPCALRHHSRPCEQLSCVVIQKITMVYQGLLDCRVTAFLAKTVCDVVNIGAQ
jgi:hypothetical protein